MNDDDLKNTILECLDGQLSADEERFLVARIRGDKEAEALFAKLMRFHGSLPILLKETQSSQAQGPSVGDAQKTIKLPVQASGARLPWGTHWKIASLAASVLLVLGIGWWALTSGARPAVPQVASCQGGFVLRHEQRLVITPKMSLLPGDKLHVEKTASLKYADGTTVEVGADTDIENQSENASSLDKALCCLAGNMELEVTPQQAGHPMLVSTPTTRVAVLGTHLAVRTDAKQTQVEVTHGRVLVTTLADNKEVFVTGGQYTNVVPNAPLAVMNCPTQFGDYTKQGRTLYEFNGDLSGLSFENATATVKKDKAGMPLLEVSTNNPAVPSHWMLTEKLTAAFLVEFDLVSIRQKSASNPYLFRWNFVSEDVDKFSETTKAASESQLVHWKLKVTPHRDSKGSLGARVSLSLDKNTRRPVSVQTPVSYFPLLLNASIELSNLKIVELLP